MPIWKVAPAKSWSLASTDRLKSGERRVGAELQSSASHYRLTPCISKKLACPPFSAFVVAPVANVFAFSVSFQDHRRTRERLRYQDVGGFVSPCIHTLLRCQCRESKALPACLLAH